jgi:hypothetical protein
LAEALTENHFEKLLDAIASFERKMCLRIPEITNSTLENTEIMNSENALEKMLHFFNNEMDYHATEE